MPGPRIGGEPAVTILDIAWVLICAAAIVYVTYALIRPERFG
mgnify:FL=1